MSPEYVADVVAEDLDQPRQFEGEGFCDAPSQNHPQTPEVYHFSKGEIWSRLGGDHPISIGGALEVLKDLERRADPTSRLYWPNACHNLSNQLADAIADYRAHWTKQLELAR